MPDDDDLEVLTAVADEFQERLIAGRLTEAGIRCMLTPRGLKRSISEEAGKQNPAVP
jgi:hypothetical protein